MADDSREYWQTIANEWTVHALQRTWRTHSDAVNRRLWRRYKHAFVCSDNVRGRVDKARLRPGGPLEVLHPGVDLDWFFDDGGSRDDFFLVAGPNDPTPVDSGSYFDLTPLDSANDFRRRNGKSTVQGDRNSLGIRR